MAAEINIEQHMVGMNIEDIYDALLLLSWSEVRIVDEKQPITMEYNSRRLNIFHRDGIITEVNFG